MKKLLSCVLSEAPQAQADETRLAMRFVWDAVRSAQETKILNKFGIINRAQTSNAEMSDLHETAHDAWMDAAKRLGYEPVSESPLPQPASESKTPVDPTWTNHPFEEVDDFVLCMQFNAAGERCGLHRSAAIHQRPFNAAWKIRRVAVPDSPKMRRPNMVANGVRISRAEAESPLPGREAQEEQDYRWRRTTKAGFVSTYSVDTEHDYLACLVEQLLDPSTASLVPLTGIPSSAAPQLPVRPQEEFDFREAIRILEGCQIGSVGMGYREACNHVIEIMRASMR